MWFLISLLAFNSLFAQEMSGFDNEKTVKDFYASKERVISGLYYTEGYSELKKYSLVGSTGEYWSIWHSGKDGSEKVSIYLNNSCGKKGKLGLDVKNSKLDLSLSFKCKGLMISPFKDYLFAENDKYAIKARILNQGKDPRIISFVLLEKSKTFYGTDFLYRKIVQ